MNNFLEARQSLEIDRLKDKLNERENELADFKLRLWRCLNSLEEI